jgi:hypothetical protein
VSTHVPGFPGSEYYGRLYEPDTQTTEVFARDVNNHLIHAYLTSAGWQPWSTIGPGSLLQGNPVPSTSPTPRPAKSSPTTPTTTSSTPT